MRGGGISEGNPALNRVAGAVSEQNPDGGVGLIFALKGPRNAALYLRYDPVIPSGDAVAIAKASKSKNLPE